MAAAPAPARLGRALWDLIFGYKNWVVDGVFYGVFDGVFDGVFLRCFLMVFFMFVFFNGRHIELLDKATDDSSMGIPGS